MLVPPLFFKAGNLFSRFIGPQMGTEDAPRRDHIHDLDGCDDEIWDFRYDV